MQPFGGSAATGFAREDRYIVTMDAAKPANESAVDQRVADIDMKSPEEEPMEVEREAITIVKRFTWCRKSDSGCSSESPQSLPIVFRWAGEGETALVSGSYDNWTSKMPLVKSQDDFYTVVEVPEGTHQYKYIVDGDWRCHPNEPMVQNEIGSKNNVISIRKSECDLKDILFPDDIEEGERKKQDDSKFSQFIPPKVESNCCLPGRGPPLIPPHLLQTVLNKDIPVYCEPTIVDEPTHVVLNHLYTLSIKDGVMVLGSTHRYRKKYITTLLYRPIIERLD